MIRRSTLRRLVRQYLADPDYPVKNDRWIKHVRSHKSNAWVAMEVAVLSEDKNHKLHPHQNRIGRERLNKLHNYMRANHVLYSMMNQHSEKTLSFDMAMKFVGTMIQESCIRRIGELAVYDITCRFMAAYGIEPRFVYLHNGTMIGAKKLGLVTRGQKRLHFGDIMRSNYWPELLNGFKGKTQMRDIENFLCIYKDEF